MPVFQFHYGSVKSSSFSKRTFCSAKFQFHYGSVKSVWFVNTLDVR